MLMVGQMLPSSTMRSATRSLIMVALVNTMNTDCGMALDDVEERLPDERLAAQHDEDAGADVFALVDDVLDLSSVSSSSSSYSDA